MQRGRFITIEGGEGTGKSTQIARLAARLRPLVGEVFVTRELGGSPGAEQIRISQEVYDQLADEDVKGEFVKSGSSYVATRLTFPKLDRKMYPIEDDQQFAYELLAEQKVLIVQGTGFNWAEPDHLRIVFLPNSDDLTDAIGRIAKFLEHYRKRHAQPGVSMLRAVS